MESAFWSADKIAASYAKIDEVNWEKLDEAPKAYQTVPFEPGEKELFDAWYEQIVNQTKMTISNLVAEGRQKVEAGTLVAQQCSDVLNEIALNVSGVASMADEIATASREQAQGVAEINKKAK
ncbi:MAG: hypothetical protein H7256_09450 [Bdellovibrio sp.]|nr:hypothetical protein [Bdellovibrio sp.]